MLRHVLANKAARLARPGIERTKGVATKKEKGVLYAHAETIWAFLAKVQKKIQMLGTFPLSCTHVWLLATVACGCLSSWWLINSNVSVLDPAEDTTTPLTTSWWEVLTPILNACAAVALGVNAHLACTHMFMRAELRDTANNIGNRSKSPSAPRLRVLAARTGSATQVLPAFKSHNRLEVPSPAKHLRAVANAEVCAGDVDGLEAHDLPFWYYMPTQLAYFLAKNLAFASAAVVLVIVAVMGGASGCMVRTATMGTAMSCAQSETDMWIVLSSWASPIALAMLIISTEFQQNEEGGSPAHDSYTGHCRIRAHARRSGGERGRGGL